MFLKGCLTTTNHVIPYLLLILNCLLSCAFTGFLPLVCGWKIKNLIFSLLLDLPLQISESGLLEWWVDARCFSCCSRCVVLIVVMPGLSGLKMSLILLSLASLLWFVLGDFWLDFFCSPYFREDLYLLSLLLSFCQP